MKWINELVDGDHLIGQLLVIGANKGITEKGLAYINVTFQDKTGSLEAKKWDATETDLATLVPGAVVNVEGVINLYKNQNQLKILSVSKVEDLSRIDLTQFQ